MKVGHVHCPSGRMSALCRSRGRCLVARRGMDYGCRDRRLFRHHEEGFSTEIGSDGKRGRFEGQHLHGVGLRNYVSNAGACWNVIGYPRLAS